MLTWIQYADFVDGLATRAELWSAQLTSDRALVPSLLHRDVEPNDARVGDSTHGWYAPTGIYLVDVATGAETVLPAPAGTSCQPDRTLYVSRSDVLLGWCVADGEARIYAYRLDPRRMSL